MARRDDWLERVAGGRRASRGREPHRRRPLLGVTVGWLVLMTVWGIGRSGFPAHVGWFLAAGLVAGVVTTIVLWRR